MKKIISFSLFGKDPMYLQGAIANSQQAKEYYPGWITRFYVGKSVPDEIVAELEQNSAEIVRTNAREDFTATFWRFYAFADPDVELVLIRDADSRFSTREATAVQEWLISGKSYHIMRDHPYHCDKIMGGMWGARAHGLRQIREVIDQEVHENQYGTDQLFLRKCVYPKVIKDSCIHASFFRWEKHAIPFPKTRDGEEFVGERFDQNDKPSFMHRNMLKRYENNAPLCFLREFVCRVRNIFNEQN